MDFMVGEECEMSQQWYYVKGGQRQGPVSAGQLKELATSRTLQQTDLVWREGMPQWVQATTVTGLFPTASSAPPPAVPPPLMPTTTPTTATLAQPTPRPPSTGSGWAWFTDKNHPASKIVGGIISVLIVLGFCVRFFALFTGPSGHGPGTLLTFNRGQLLYKAPVTEAEARRLGQYLVENNFFDGEQKTTQISKTDNKYVFRMVLKKGIEPGTFLSEILRTFGGQISSAVFNGVPVEMHLCDDMFKTISVLPPASSVQPPGMAIYQRFVSLAATCETAESVINNENASSEERSRAIDGLIQAIKGIKNETDSMLLVLDRTPANDLTPNEQAEMSANRSSMRKMQASLPAALEALERMKSSSSKAVFDANWATFQEIMDEILPPDSASSGASVPKPTSSP